MLGFLVGIAGVAFHGLIIVTLGLHPVLVTLGTFALFRGIAYAFSSANAVSRGPLGRLAVFFMVDPTISRPPWGDARRFGSATTWVAQLSERWRPITRRVAAASC